MRRREKLRILSSPKNEFEKQIEKLHVWSPSNGAIEKWMTESWKFLENEDFVILAINFCHSIFGLLPKHFYSNRRVCLEAVSICGTNLGFCDKLLQSDREFVMTALHPFCDANVLRWVDEAFLYDKQVLLKAIHGNIWSISYFPKEMLTDEFWKEILFMHPILIEKAPHLNQDRDLILSLARKDLSIIKYMGDKNPYVSDLDFIQTLMLYYPKLSVSWISKDLLYSPNFLFENPNHDPETIPIDIITSPGFLMKYIEKYGDRVFGFKTALLDYPYKYLEGIDPDIITEILISNPFCIQKSQYLRFVDHTKDLVILNKLVKMDPRNILIFSPKQWRSQDNAQQAIADVLKEGKSSPWYQYAIEVRHGSYVHLDPEDAPSDPLILTSTLTSRWSRQDWVKFAKNNLDCFFLMRSILVNSYNTVRKMCNLTSEYVDLLLHHFPNLVFESCAYDTLVTLAWRYDARFFGHLQEFTGFGTVFDYDQYDLCKKCLQECPDLIKKVMFGPRDELDGNLVKAAISGLDLNGIPHQPTIEDYYSRIGWPIVKMDYELYNDPGIYQAFRESRKIVLNKVVKAQNLSFQFKDFY